MREAKRPLAECLVPEECTAPRTRAITWRDEVVEMQGGVFGAVAFAAFHSAIA